VPYDSQRLAIYVGSVVLCTIMFRYPVDDWLKIFLQLLQLTTTCFGLFILCGASPYEKLTHTALAAAYFATLCWCEAPVFAADTVTFDGSMTLQQQFHQRLRGRVLHKSTIIQQRQNLLQTIVLYSCISCTIPLQILLLYDRGWQLQRWPIPVILGSTIGSIGGTVFGTLAITTNRLDSLLERKKLDRDDTPS